jgi:hypothetical protein
MIIQRMVLSRDRMMFTREQLIKGIARQRFLAAEYKGQLRLALAAWYTKRADELEAELLARETACVS